MELLDMTLREGEQRASRSYAADRIEALLDALAAGDERTPEGALSLARDVD